MILKLRIPVLLFLGSFVFLLAEMLFNIYHWPGVRLITGAMLLTQVIAIVKLLTTFLPSWFALLFIVGVIGMMAGLLFKIMHWPNAQLVFGAAAIVNVLIVVRLVVVLLKE